MKNLVFAVFTLASISGFASPTTILEKSAASGFVMPQYRFAKSCVVTSNGKMRIEIKKPDESGEWQSKITNIQLSRKMTDTIKSLMTFAARGEITEVPMPCDVGTRILRGYVKAQLVEIDSARDCNSHKINKSDAAIKVKELSLKLCQF